jgi:hypothetical protein
MVAVNILLWLLDEIYALIDEIIQDFPDANHLLFADDYMFFVV